MLQIRGVLDVGGHEHHLPERGGRELRPQRRRREERGVAGLPAGDRRRRRRPRRRRIEADAKRGPQKAGVDRRARAVLVADDEALGGELGRLTKHLGRALLHILGEERLEVRAEPAQHALLIHKRRRRWRSACQA